MGILGRAVNTEYRGGLRARRLATDWSIASMARESFGVLAALRWACEAKTCRRVERHALGFSATFGTLPCTIFPKTRRPHVAGGDKSIAARKISSRHSFSHLHVPVRYACRKP